MARLLLKRAIRRTQVHCDAWLIKKAVFAKVAIWISILNQIWVAIVVYVCDGHSPEVRNKSGWRLKCPIAIAEGFNQIVSTGYPSLVRVEADQKIEVPIVVEVDGNELLREILSGWKRKLLFR